VVGSRVVEVELESSPAEQATATAVAANTTQNLIITGIFILICAALSLIVPKFLTLRNIRYLFIQVAYVVISSSDDPGISREPGPVHHGLAAMGVMYALLARAGTGPRGRDAGR
jgi:hypothetical protein